MRTYEIDAKTYILANVQEPMQLGEIITTAVDLARVERKVAKWLGKSIPPGRWELYDYNSAGKPQKRFVVSDNSVVAY